MPYIMPSDSFCVKVFKNASYSNPFDWAVMLACSGVRHMG